MADEQSSTAAIEDYLHGRPHVPAARRLQGPGPGHRRRGLRRGRRRLRGLLGPPGRRAGRLVQPTGTRSSSGTCPFAKWFVGGKLNVSHNCLDRHVEAGHGDKVAYHWEGEPGDTRTITYADLLAEVQRFANVLKGLGVAKGDRVAIYMPMIPELPVAMLACARIGAAHSVVFGGFSADSLSRPHQRRRVQGRRHRRRRLAPGRRPACSSPPSTWPSPTRPSVEHVVVVERSPATATRRRGRRHDRGPRPLVPRAHGRRRRRLPARADGQRRPALPALHLGHHGQAQGHHAHHRRLPHAGRLHPQVRLRPAPRDRRLLVRRRHRLGHRPQLHRLRPARQRRHQRDVRGHARHARARTGCGPSSRSTASRSSTPRPPPSAPS